MFKARLLLIFTLSAFLAAAAFAQPRLASNIREVKPEPTPPATNTAQNRLEQDEDMIRVETGIVSMPVKVVDREGRFVSGLKQRDFHVFEDDVEQDVALFSNEQEPFTVALVLDMSYSAKFKAEEIQAAALAFVDQLRPKDKVMVVSFDQEIYVQCEPTNDRRVLRNAIKRTRISYGTSLYDAMQLVFSQKFRRVKGRKAIVLFSDGVDTSSQKADGPTNLRDATELDALIYPIEYDTFKEVQSMRRGNVVVRPGGSPEIVGDPVKGTTPEEYKIAAEYLDELATRTGGRLYKAATIASLSEAFSKIASELREYYSLGYYPKDQENAGRKRRIRVRVDRPGALVRAKGK